VLNADVLGKCVVHNAGRDGATQLVSWRDAGRAPGATAVSLLR
jgi:hypothetical protein